MAQSLLKRIMVFVIAYLTVSTILAYVFREDQSYITIGETIDYQGKELSLKILYKEGEELWANESLLLASGAIEKLIEGFDMDPPHKQITIYSSTLEKTGNYPFKLERDASNISVATDYEVNPVVWGVAQMWILRGFTQLPNWVVWGYSAFMSYWALGQSGFEDESGQFKGHLEEISSYYDDELAIGSYNLPGKASDESDKVGYFLGKSFGVYEDLYDYSSIEALSKIFNGTISSQNYEWDSVRYVSYVQDNTEKDVSAAFDPVFSGNVESEISKWRILHYSELILTVLITLLIILWAFWDNIKRRFKFLLYLRERSKAGRELLKKYGSKDRIMMEMEVYFKRHIPDDEYESLSKIFYNEIISENKA
ncbi:MAG: hypothetical protein JW825_01835 [Candidatus Methanofastidiosa archaeon]|nr:hypothetical protein [Candidatus Methanofastidiosa archaeon]